MLKTNTEDHLDALRAHVGSKSDYLPRTLNEARDDFIQRAKETAKALRKGEVIPYFPAPMARQMKKTEKFCIKIGYGRNNAYLANSVHKASQVLKYDTANEAASDIETVIIPLAKAGEFDVSLKTTLDIHKERAEDRKAVVAANRMAFEKGIQNDETFTPKVAAE